MYLDVRISIVMLAQHYNYVFSVSPQGGVNIEPSMATVERGETITLACSSLGGPGNTFTWTQLSTGLQVSSEESLTVSVSSGADGGVYQCLVENDAGNDTADATVIGNDVQVLM